MKLIINYIFKSNAYYFCFLIKLNTICIDKIIVQSIEIMIFVYLTAESHTLVKCSIQPSC